MVYNKFYGSSFPTVYVDSHLFGFIMLYNMFYGSSFLTVYGMLIATYLDFYYYGISHAMFYRSCFPTVYGMLMSTFWDLLWCITSFTAVVSPLFMVC